jgi:CRISPR-associated exonuclease Cas4
MFTDDDLLPISALQHLLYCPRQCALIHNEQAWAENVLTAQGRLLHEKADSGKVNRRKAGTVARSVQLVSRKLGIWGKADTVEITPGGAVRPVEYKGGQPKRNDCDRVQLCAQALCLEEMLNVTVDGGAIFYGQTRRREDVTFDDALRERTRGAVADLRELIDSRVTPSAVYEKRKCDRCSLIDLCLPVKMGLPSLASSYINRAIASDWGGR